MLVLAYALLTIAVPIDILSHIWRREALKLTFLYFVAQRVVVWVIVRERLSWMLGRWEKSSYSVSSN